MVQLQIQGRHRKLTWLDRDPSSKTLERTQKQCEARYRPWVRESIAEGEWKLIRHAVQRGQLTGTSQFVEEVFKKTARWVGF